MRNIDGFVIDGLVSHVIINNEIHTTEGGYLNTFALFEDFIVAYPVFKYFHK